MRVSISFAGPIFILTHEDVEDVVRAAGQMENLAPKVVAVMAAATILTGGMAALVSTVIVAYLAAEGLALKAMDRGNGVYLTIPWTAIPTNAYWLIIPTPYPPRGDADWIAGLDEGHLGTEDEDDDIHFIVEHNAAPPHPETGGPIVLFKLVNPTSSDKKINMPDGGGSSWDIIAEDGGGEADNALDPPQVHNGQQLTFSNHIALGFWDDVLWLGNLERLQPGDRVTFIWEKD